MQYLFYTVIAILASFASLCSADNILNKTTNTISGGNEKSLEKINEKSKTNLECPPDQKKLCMILALSKIAKVQIADSNMEPEIDEPTGRILEPIQRRIDYFNSGKKPDAFSAHRIPGLGEYDGYSQNLRNDESKTVQCRAIRDVYIPEAKQKLPAFACKYGSRIFVLSSERFLEDRRTSLYINVEDNIFHDVQLEPKTSKTNDFNRIPALLVLKPGEDNYKIRIPENGEPRR